MFEGEGEGEESKQHKLAKLAAPPSKAEKAQFLKIARGGQPEQVMRAMLGPQAAGAAGVVGSLSPAEFVEALTLLSPAYFVDPYRDLHRPLHPYTVQVKGYRPLGAIFGEFAERLARIVRVRREAGWSLGLAEYTHLLDCARAMGDGSMADILWQDMQSDGVMPDVLCFNHYMGARVWDTAFVDKEKYNLRVTPYYYRKRRFAEPNVGWRGFGTAGRSVRRDVSALFRQMTDLGIEGDETTSINLILAAGRVGHDRGIRNVLRTVWNIDVDALSNDSSDIGVADADADADAGAGAARVDGDESQVLPPVVRYERTSHMHPTPRLLFAIAHALSTNNDVPAALKTVDFVSRAYDVPITAEVWMELFERGFQLSRKRFGTDTPRNLRGQISFEYLENILHTMASPPYNVEPAAQVIYWMAKVAWDLHRIDEFEQYMTLAYSYMCKVRKKRHDARYLVGRYLSRLAQAADPEDSHHAHTQPAEAAAARLSNSRGFVDAVNRYDILRLAVAQQTTSIERLARLMVIKRWWLGRSHLWERRILPDRLRTWRDFLPSIFCYNTTGGQVTMHGMTYFGDRYLNLHNLTPVRRGDKLPSGIVETRHQHQYQHQRHVDDDFFWAILRNNRSDIDFARFPLCRLIWSTPDCKRLTQLLHYRSGHDVHLDGLVL